MKGSEYMNYYEEIKNRLEYNEAYKKIKDYSKNRSDLQTYYDVGRLIVEAQGGETRSKYGDKLIEEYSRKLIMEVGKEYSVRTLRRYRQFYLFCKKQKWSALRTKLTWAHIRELFPLKDINAINYYVQVVENDVIGYRKLHERIKSKEYERLPEEVKNKLIVKEELKPLDLVKNPIYIENTKGIKNIKENILEDLIMEQLQSFLKQLGNGFMFYERQYKLQMKSKDNYIDILLFNIEFNSYVVCELKIREVKKEDFGQLKIYMNYIDKKVKKQNHNLTLGLIICKKDDGIYAEFYPDDRIKVIEFKIF